MDTETNSEATGREARVAASLMRMALALLDRTEESLATARLQQALDALDRQGPAVPTIADPDAPVGQEGRSSSTPS